MAHVVRDKVEVAYARSDLFARRRQLMNEWAAYLNGRAAPAIRLPADAAQKRSAAQDPPSTADAHGSSASPVPDGALPGRSAGRAQ